MGNGYKGPTSAGTYNGYCDPTGDVVNGISTPLSYSGYDAYCGSPNTSITYLALWQKDHKTALDTTKGLVATFCKPAFYSQPANVTIFQKNQSIQSITRTCARAALDPSTFNTSHFKNMIAAAAAGNIAEASSGEAIIDTSALVLSSSLGYTPNGKGPTVTIGLTLIPKFDMPKPGSSEAVVRSAHKLMLPWPLRAKWLARKKACPSKLPALRRLRAL